MRIENKLTSYHRLTSFFNLIDRPDPIMMISLGIMSGMDPTRTLTATMARERMNSEDSLDTCRHAVRVHPSREGQMT